MNKFTPLLLSFFVITVLLTSCGKVIEPEFRRVEKFAIKNAGLRDVTVAFDVVYYNPNKFGVKVRDAVLDIYIDSVYIGKFTQPVETLVNQLADFSIPVEGKISLQQAFKLDIPNLIGREVFIKANGNIKIGKTGVYMNRPIVYEGRQTINVDLMK